MNAADRDHLKIFAGRYGREVAQAMCEHLDLPVGASDVEPFPDGEIIMKVNEDVRGRDCFVVQSTCEPVNESLMELLISIDCLRRASAKRITAVIPYFGYARQDRKDEGRVPITAKLVANLITHAGANRVLAMDLHAAQIQGFFDIPVDHLYAAPVIDSHFQGMNLKAEETVVVSPDEGGIKRALSHMNQLGGELAIIDKRRASAERTQQVHIIGANVQGRTALIFDDMISTASSICGAADVVHAHGARQIYLAATHGLFCADAVRKIREAPVDGVLVTDTIPLGPEKELPKIVTLSVAPLLGEAIKRIHRNESISRLFV
jgi:ribose-phosphate pyrophosphokinase